MAEEQENIPCRWCGGSAHDELQCSRVKALEFDAAMNIKRVEFLTPADYVAKDEATPERSDYPKLGGH